MITINLPSHFSFSECLWFLDRGYDEVLYSVDQKSVRRPIRFEEEVVLIQITSSNGSLNVNIIHGDAGEKAQEVAKNYVEDWFDLKEDLSPFYAIAQEDTILKPLVKAYKGLRLIGIIDLFEAFCWSIIGQQINLTFAYKLKRALTEKFGSKTSFDGIDYYLFPQPDQLAHISREDLLDIQFSRQKADYVINLAQVLLEGELHKKTLIDVGFSGALDEMVKVKGIGPWTANYVAMKCLRFKNAFPLQDVGLHNALKAQLNLDKKPTLEEIVKMAEPWEGWKAYATLYLWRSLSLKG